MRRLSLQEADLPAVVAPRQRTPSWRPALALEIHPPCGWSPWHLAQCSSSATRSCQPSLRVSTWATYGATMPKDMSGCRFSHSTARSNTKDASSGLDTLPPSSERRSSNPQPAVSTHNHGRSPSKVRAATFHGLPSIGRRKTSIARGHDGLVHSVLHLQHHCRSGWRSTKRSIIVRSNTRADLLFTVGGNWHGSPDSTKRVARSHRE